jgi:hypothetical protein
MAEPCVNHLTEVALLLAEATDGADPALVMAGLKLFEGAARAQP